MLKTLHTKRGIKRRRWCLDDFEAKDWLRGSAALSRWFDVYSLLVPDNEAFFIRTLKPCTDFSKTEHEKKELLNFLQQESMHGVAHRVHWRKIQESGVVIDQFLKPVNWVLYSVLERAQPKCLRISVVAAIEHINACLAHSVLERNLLKGSPESLRIMFYWHFAEEVEHKAVAHKVLRNLYPGYLGRLAGATIAFPTFYFLCFMGMFWLLAKDRKLFTLDTGRHLFDFWIRQGALITTIRQLSSYFSISFDPWEVNDRHLASRSGDAERRTGYSGLQCTDVRRGRRRIFNRRQLLTPF